MTDEPKEITRSRNLAQGLPGTLSALLAVLYLLGMIYIIGYMLATNFSLAAIPEPSETLYTTVSTLGGLVGALVIAVLAAVQPGQDPALVFLGADTPDESRILQQKRAGIVISTYIYIWIGVGLVSLLIGTLFPGEQSQVSTVVQQVGTNWLGIAVAAAYAYFGITPQGAIVDDDEDEFVVE